MQGRLQPIKQQSQFQTHQMLAEPTSLPPNPSAHPPSPLPNPPLSPALTSPPSPLSPKKRGRRPMKESPDGRASAEGKKQNFGHWSLQENKRYHWFLEIHHVHFLNKHLRRMDKIFKGMALFVGSREAEQCRSHHQKMEKKYDHSICRILTSLRHQHYHDSQLSYLEDELREHQLLPCYPLLTSTFLNQRHQGEREDEGEEEAEGEGEEGQGAEGEGAEGGEEVRMIEEVIDWGECNISLQQLLNDHNNAPHNLALI